MGEGKEQGLGHRLWRISWLLFLIGQGMLASAWWWLAPGGLAPGHARFWLNAVAAPAIAIAAVATLWALRGERWGSLRRLLPAWAAGWAGLSLALGLLFPITMGMARAWPVGIALPMVLALEVSRRLWGSRRGLMRLLVVSGMGTVVVLGSMAPVAQAGPGLVPYAIAAAMGLASLRPWRMGADAPRRFGGLLAAIGGSALAGVAIAAALRPPAAGTHPLDPAIATAEPGDPSHRRMPPGVVQLGPDATIQTFDGSLMARVDRLTIRVLPLLTFLSRSPDGAPVVLVPAEERAGPEPKLRDGWRCGDRAWLLAYEFPGQGPATLRAKVEPATGSILMEAAGRLDRAAFSHLNGFCDVEVGGHRRLALEFSPCPGEPVEVRHFGYPAGAPARFALVSADRTFRVVEASSGEKGPFRTLARGRLDPGEPLAITLHDSGRPVARVSLDDFAAQADTTLSPTAGWGVPVNAIEFSLASPSPSSSASIFVTLAGTSVGRGWDCVAHRAGTYRNRIRIERIGDAGEAGAVGLSRRP